MLEWLKTILGDAYTEDIDKKVSAEIGKGFVARADFNTVNEAKKALDGQIKERDAQLEELKKVDADALQAKIAELQTANTQAQEKHAADLKAAKRDFALETRLVREGAVNAKAVRALLDDGKISLDGDNLIGLDEQLTALKESDPWAFSGAKKDSDTQSGVRVNSGGTHKPAQNSDLDNLSDAEYYAQINSKKE